MPLLSTIKHSYGTDDASMQPQTVTFDCTMCGRCCHGLRLPLSVDEAIDWIDRGGRVELLCDAGPVGHGKDYGPSRTSYQSSHTFAGVTGSLPIQVSVTLVATFSGACPFLLPDMRCGNYVARPQVCRVYPAEANPFVTLDPAAKACPSEAWEPSQPVLLRNYRVVEPAIRTAIAGMRQAGPHDVAAKALLCSLLNIDVVAFANEGLAVHAPDQAELRQALKVCRATTMPSGTPVAWRIATNRSATMEMLESAGCTVIYADKDFISFFPTDLPAVAYRGEL